MLYFLSGAAVCRFHIQIEAYQFIWGGKNNRQQNNIHSFILPAPLGINTNFEYPHRFAGNSAYPSAVRQAILFNIQCISIIYGTTINQIRFCHFRKTERCYCMGLSVNVADTDAPIHLLDIHIQRACIEIAQCGVDMICCIGKQEKKPMF